MDLQELRAVQNRERATDSPQELRDSFYEDVAAYIGDLKAERERIADQVDDPFSSEEVSQLTDEIEMAEQVAEAIYERRVGKIVKQASLAAAGMGADPDGLTAEERDLHADLVDRIGDNKEHVLDVLSGDADAPSDADADAPTDDPVDPEPSRSTERVDPDPPERDPDLDAASAMDGDETSAPEPPEDEEDGDETDGDEVSRETVRITDDVGEIFGVDERVYTLESDDVVTLPEENAAPLVDREAAERLN